MGFQYILNQAQRRGKVGADGLEPPTSRMKTPKNVELAVYAILLELESFNN